MSSQVDLLKQAQDAINREAPPPPLSEILGEVRAFIGRYVVLSPPQADATTLWVAHTHAIAAAETTPYLSLRSPEKRSGKTRLLEVLELVARHPLRCESISPAALAHSISHGRALLLDEVDAIFGRGGSTAQSETREALRGILDSGYRRGGSYVRMAGVGANMAPTEFP